ncbi:N-acetyltransferase GCN5 [Legionella beliardensis]|uniref:[Ribosomal protein bS18]-alanine N-acetyltransferase n=1 Tax=Legionella beliardensis TaxID=91822 RepID=A0A378I1A3_9GAMM|nr:ribosomal protein S18-alanine N-acetyltransferase [Legionella beliardensis]STX28763.1 N-acetyltransferase GCN5 [Legionella beliardensis]
MFTVRSMQFKDIDEVYHIELTGHRTPWSRDILNDCVLVGYDCYVLEQEKNKKIVGYIISRQHLTVYHILNLCIIPSMQGKGLGKYLLKAIIDKLNGSAVDSMILEVRPSNQRAISLYQRFGFQLDSIKKDYYQDTNSQEDAWLLRKVLQQPPSS